MQLLHRPLQLCLGGCCCALCIHAAPGRREKGSADHFSRILYPIRSSLPLHGLLTACCTIAAAFLPSSTLTVSVSPPGPPCRCALPPYALHQLASCG